jgi:hypothetical protein
MNIEQHWEEGSQVEEESDSDSNSVLSYYSNETPSCYEPEPLCVNAGDGVDDIFYIHHWEEEFDSRIPIRTAFISVHHHQKMRDWWTNKIVEELILRQTDRYEGK